MTDLSNADLVRLYRLPPDGEGLSTRGVARRLGVAQDTARLRLIAAGATMRPGRAAPIPRPADDKLRVWRERDRLTYQQIADKLGPPVTATAVRRWCGQLNPPLRRYTRKGRPGAWQQPGAAAAAHPGDHQLHELYVVQGLSTYAIGDRYKVSPDTVSNWLAAAGIPRRSPGGQQEA